MEAVGSGFSFPWEVALMEWLQGHISESLTPVISQCSLPGEEIALVLIIGIIYWGISKKMGRYIGFNLRLGSTFAGMIKNVVCRRRPYFDHETIKSLRPVDADADLYDVAAQGYSFPSIHSSNTASVFGSMAVHTGRENHRHRYFFAVLAPLMMLLVGFSRVYVGAHYPTDVLAGWCIGWAAIFISTLIRDKVRDLRAACLIFLVLAIPGFFFCRSNDYFTSVGLLLGFMAGNLFDEYIGHFENTKKPLVIVLRLLGGVLVYLILNTLLKLPFSAEFLEQASLLSWTVRAVRYAIISFVAFGVYPMSFRWIK